MTSLLETANGRLLDGGEADLDQLFDGLGNAAKPKLLFYVHGGLVTDDAARKQATWLDGDAGFGQLKAEGWQTSYLIWRTGLFETIRINLHELAGDRLFSAVKAVLRRFVARKGLDIVDSLEENMKSKAFTLSELDNLYSQGEFRPHEEIEAQLTAHELAIVEGDVEPGPGDELYDALASDPELLQLSSSVEQAMQVRRSKSATLQAANESALKILENLDDEVRRELDASIYNNNKLLAPAFFTPIFWRAAKAGYKAVGRAIRHRDHGFQATVIEEIARILYIDLIGTGVWSAMKGDAADHFRSNGAGTMLLDRLKKLADSTDGPIRLLFVGHSAGAVLGCALLEAAKSFPDNVIIDFVLLAPAVRMDKAAAAFAASDLSLQNIRIFTMSDEREKADPLDGALPVNVYPRSLLYLISGILENRDSGGAYADAPILGMQRHIEGLDNRYLSGKERLHRDQISEFLGAKPSQIIYSQSNAGAGLNTDARSHTGFDNDAETLASIRHIALKGY